MINIVYPNFDFKIKERYNKQIIYDEIRKKWFILTPEEWVRQNFIQYLIQVKQFPATLIAVEKEIKVGELRKRFDIIVYKNNVPWMIVECKQMDVVINGNVLSQVLAYNSTIKSKYIVLTNGNSTFLWAVKDNKAIEQDQFCNWNQDE